MTPIRCLVGTVLTTIAGVLAVGSAPAHAQVGPSPLSPAKRLLEQVADLKFDPFSVLVRFDIAADRWPSNEPSRWLVVGSSRSTTLCRDSCIWRSVFRSTARWRRSIKRSACAMRSRTGSAKPRACPTIRASATCGGCATPARPSTALDPWGGLLGSGSTSTDTVADGLDGRPIQWVARRLRGRAPRMSGQLRRRRVPTPVASTTSAIAPGAGT